MASGADTDATANAVLHAARDNLEKVGLAMDTVRSIAKKERVRLLTIEKTTRKSFALKVAKMHKVMAADASINGVPITSLDPAQYGIGKDPLDSKMGRTLQAKVAACKRAIAAADKVMVLVAHITAHHPLHEHSKGAGTSAAAAASHSAMLLDETVSLTSPPIRHRIKVNTQAFVAQAKTEHSLATEVKKLRKESQTAQIQSRVDGEIIAYLKQLAAKNIKQAAIDKHVEDRREQAAWRSITGSSGTPVAAALHRLQQAHSMLTSAFKPLLADALSISHAASSSVAAINAAKLLSGIAPANVATPALQRVLSVLRSARNVLQTIVPIHAAFNVQYSHVSTILDREQKRLSSAMVSSIGKKLALKLRDPAFMELTKQYDQELKLKAKAHEVVVQVQQACRSPGEGPFAAAQPPTAAHVAAAHASSSGGRRRLQAAHVFLAGMPQPWLHGFVLGLIACAAVQMLLI